MSCIVVSQTEVASYDDATADCIQKRLEDRLCVHVRCLNEYGVLCVFDGGEEGRILGGIDAAVVRSWTAVSLILSMMYRLYLHPHGSRLTSAIGNGSCGGDRT